MDKQRKELIHFAQTAKGLDNHTKLKLILFASGEKPATFIALRVSPKNLGAKKHLEKHLNECKIPFIVSKPRAYEEVVGVKGNAVKWKIKGSWYGYDLFRDVKTAKLFQKYLELVKRQKHLQADRVAGELYDYPKCCVKSFIKMHDATYVQKNYTHYTYYKRLHEIEKAFPLLMHTACTTKCKASKRMNARYAAALKKHASKFWKKFSATKVHKVDVVVDTESDIGFDKKDGHEYVLITLKPIEKHYYLFSHLTKKELKRGTVFPATITIRYHYADAMLHNPKRHISNLHHERRFVLP